MLDTQAPEFASLFSSKHYAEWKRLRDRETALEAKAGREAKAAMPIKIARFEI
jgi:hypothetical protein